MCIDCHPLSPSLLLQRGGIRGYRNTRGESSVKSAFSPLPPSLCLSFSETRTTSNIVKRRYPARAATRVYPSRRAPPFDKPLPAEVSASLMLRSARAQRDLCRSLILIRTLIVRPIRRTGSHILRDSYTRIMPIYLPVYLLTYLPTYLPV